MLRALFGLIFGTLLAVVAAVLYGKFVANMSAADFEPVLLIALGVGAVLGLLAGILTRRPKVKTT